MENLGTKLMQKVEDLSEIEVQRLEVQLAKFNRLISEYYELKISEIEENIDAQIDFYGKEINDYTNQKNNILNKYNKEFQKNYDKRKEQFFNIQVEIQEIQVNQKIVFANYKKIAEDRKKLLTDKKYLDYLNKKNEFQKVVDSAVNREDFEKYTKLLEELEDPLSSYSIKLEALVNKYAGYNEIIEECENKLNECILETKNDFDEITKYRNSSVIVVENNNFVVNIINKIINKFIGKYKFEKDVIQKMEDELVQVEENNLVNINDINKQTINLIAKIEELRETVNVEFKLTME